VEIDVWRDSRDPMGFEKIERDVGRWDTDGVDKFREIPRAQRVSRDRLLLDREPGDVIGYVRHKRYPRHLWCTDARSRS